MLKLNYFETPGRRGRVCLVAVFKAVGMLPKYPECKKVVK